MSSTQKLVSDWIIKSQCSELSDDVRGVYRICAEKLSGALLEENSRLSVEARLEAVAGAIRCLHNGDNISNAEYMFDQLQIIEGKV
jgi:hypothetical protein